VHLAAAGLRRPEFDAVPQPLEHCHDGLPGLWEERIVVAGDEQRDRQRRNASGSPPSTGMTWPVVLPLWSPASQQIAFVQSTGRMGRRVIVRRA
jgi:hypothetical protein